MVDPGDSVVARALDAPCVAALGVTPGLRVLDCGTGEGSLAAAIAAAGADVVAFDVDPSAIERARARRAAVDWRVGDLHAPPLRRGEPAFDLVVARFVLESLRDPSPAVVRMAAAARPGGRIALIDDDHEPLVLWPPCPEFEPLWAACCAVFDADGDARVGRRLPALLHAAGVVPLRARTLHLGGTAGEADFPALVDRLVSVVASRADGIVARGFDRAAGEHALGALRAWASQPAATIWHHVRLAIGRVPERVSSAAR